MGFPAKGAKIFLGKRLEAKRAGMTPTIIKFENPSRLTETRLGHP